MTFISYAQNAEDVILWRALKHIEEGFYIDVGANDPEDDSVTKAFYDHGWHGINIEPLPHHHACLEIQRPRDINLQIAAGNYNGELTLYDVPSVRGWATPDPDVAEHYRQQGLEVISSTVPVRRLDSLCEELGVTDIHFLKIDVEGFETQVIQGMDFQRWRPWILIIETTRPNNEDSQHQDWQPIVLDNQYQYVYSDGLNRYYVAQEHQALADALAMQPNVFDDFQFIGYQRVEQALEHAQKQLTINQTELEKNQQQYQLQLELQQQQYQVQLELQLQQYQLQLQMQQQQQAELQSELQLRQQQQAELQAQLHALNNQLEISQQHVQSLDSQLTAVTTSLSWRITEPLRKLNLRQAQIRQALRLFAMRIGHKLKNTLKTAIRTIVNALIGPARQSRVIKAVLSRYPGLAQRARSLVRKLLTAQTAPYQPHQRRQQLDNLSEPARDIYQDIQRLTNSNP